MSVKVLMNGTWSDWGTACNISTTCAPTTDFRPGFISNSTIGSCATNIYVNSILFATSYEYSVSGGNVNDLFQLSGSGFKLSQIPSASSVTYNTTYNIKCRVFVNGSWQPWGPIRPITLSIQIQLGAFCNAVVPTMGTNVYSGSVGCASDYRFLLDGPGLSSYVHNPSTMTNRFQPSQLLAAGIQYNQTYTVEVAYLAGGVWSAYGPLCTITTPSAIMPNPNQISEIIKEEFDELSESNLANSFEIDQELKTLQIFPNPSLNSFTLRLINSEEIVERRVIRVVDFSGKIMEEIYTESNSDVLFGERLPSGVYFIHEKDNALSTPTRIVKL
jgi:hypothetical protein